MEKKLQRLINKAEKLQSDILGVYELLEDENHNSTSFELSNAGANINQVIEDLKMGLKIYQGTL